MEVKEKKPWSKKKKIIVGVVAAVVILGVYPSDKENDNTDGNASIGAENVQANNKSEYSLEFAPDIKFSTTETSVDFDFDANCPDGTLIAVGLMSGDLSEIYSETVAVEGGKVKTSFTLDDTSTKKYAGMVTLQFNSADVIQPEETKAVYGEKGELLEGETASEATFEDGESGKNATVIFDVDYPNTEAVELELDKLFAEFRTELIDTSAGLILDVSDDGDGIYRMMVSNEWYLSPETEKQYFAEESLKLFTKISKNMYGKDYAILDILDESGTTVASSKMTGGMKVKK